MNSIKKRWMPTIAALALAMAALAPANISGVHAQESSHTFPETGHTVSGRFLEYWNTHGGLAQQGYPISEPMQEVSDTDGKTYTVQYFERAVFEMHPENQPPNDVLLSLLGVFMLNQKYPNGTPTASGTGGDYFPETQKHVAEPFLSYWKNHGGLAQQGYPISERFTETSDLDGKTYEVQYFERAVFELHPENQPPYNVLLSQLGTFRLKQKQTPATATPAPATAVPTTPAAPPTNTTVPPTPKPSGPDCSDVPAGQDMTITPACGPQGTRFDQVGHGFRSGENVGVYVTYPDQSVHGVSGQGAADSSGTVTGWHFNSSATSQLGIYAVTMEGVQSHHKAIGYFKITPAGSQPPPPSGSCDTSSTHDGTATPTSGKPGDTIILRGTGFTPREGVSFWLTLPNGDVLGSAQPVPNGVAPDGSVTFPLPIDAQLVALGAGRWAMTFEGASSHHQSVIYFCLSQ